METKSFYRDRIWEAIITHPQFTLGRRELEALLRFLPVVGSKFSSALDILHLGIGNGREIEHFLRALPTTKTYVINDICQPVLERVVQGAREAFPAARFEAAFGDIETEGAIARMRQPLCSPTLFVLVANTVIFSNRMLDAELRKAMRPGDLFFVTMELPNPQMFQSYMLEPVYALLSGSGMDVHAGNTATWYDDDDQCLKMASQGRTLLAAYKPAPEKLLERMQGAGFESVELAPYEDLQMTAALFRVP